MEPPLPVIESLILKPELRTFLGDSLTFHHILGCPRRVGCLQISKIELLFQGLHLFVLTFSTFESVTEKMDLIQQYDQKKRRTPAEQANGTVSKKKTGVDFSSDLFQWFLQVLHMCHQTIHA